MFLVTPLIFTAVTGSDVARRLLTSSYSADCKIIPAHSGGDPSLPNNPSSTPVAYIMNVGDSYLSSVDLDTASNVDVDMDTAKTWCEDRFGVGSYPIYPEDADHYTLLQNVGHFYDEAVFLGLVRDIDHHNDAMDQHMDFYSNCHDWKAHDDSTVHSHDAVLNGGNDWYTGNYYKLQPTCKEYIEGYHYDAGTKKQCVSYRPHEGLYVEQCKKKVMIVCKWMDDKCDAPAVV